MSSPPLEAISIYCLADRQGLGSLADEISFESFETKVEVLHLDSVAVVCQRVDATDYTGDTGEERLRDLEWLVPRAEEHQAVVSHVAAMVTALPTRFGTLFSDRSALLAWLEPRLKVVSEGFERLRDREEWGIRLLYSQNARHKNVSSVASGSSYLLSRKKIRDQEAQRLEKIGAISQEIGQSLESICESLAKLPIRAFDGPLRQADGDTRVTVAHWAALVERSDVDRLRRGVADLADDPKHHSVDIELSGPWPAYNFCPSLETQPNA